MCRALHVRRALPWRRPAAGRPAAQGHDRSSPRAPAVALSYAKNGQWVRPGDVGVYGGAPAFRELAERRRGRGTARADPAPQDLSKIDCGAPARYRNGPGKFEDTDTNDFGPTLGNLVGGKAWRLTNFDIDKHFIKAQHEQYLRSVVAPRLAELIKHDGAYAVVVGETSTTYTWDWNQALSERRARCVSNVLKEALGKSGLTRRRSTACCRCRRSTASARSDRRSSTWARVSASPTTTGG